MASIVVSGDTSGAITIAAPAVAGTNTLTLPASTGTLVVTGGAQTIEFADGSASAPSITNSGDTNTGMFFPAADTIAFTEGGVESMRIDSSGNVGIGLSNPSFRIQTYATGGTTVAGAFRTDQTDCYITFRATGTASDTSCRIGVIGENMVFLNNGANERMRITSAGFTKMSNNGTYFGATGPYHEVRSDVANDGTLLVQSTSASFTANGIYQQIERNTTNNTFYAYSYYNGGAGAYKYRIADSGNVTNTNGSYGTISDIKNKENIVDATPKLDKVNQLKVRNYNFIGDDLKQIGFVAQEFEQVFPSMVEEHKDTDSEGNDLGTTTKSIKTSVLVPILVKAIQEQQQIINDLKARIETLENK